MNSYSWWARVINGCSFLLLSLMVKIFWHRSMSWRMFWTMWFLWSDQRARLRTVPFTRSVFTTWRRMALTWPSSASTCVTTAWRRLWRTFWARWGSRWWRDSKGCGQKPEASFCTLLYFTVIYSTVVYCTIGNCTVVYCAVVYCTVTNCTVP